MSDQNQFTNKLPTHRRKKELVIIILIFAILVTIVFVYTYIRNSPISPENFPVINIVTEEEIIHGDYVDGTFELNCPDESENIAPLKCIVKIRGRYNADLPKKGYRIELSEPKSILGMREDDDWMLFAMYSDLPRMQIKLAMELYQTLTPSNPTAILPDSEYVIVYVNRELRGLYLLVEKNDRRLFALDDAMNNIMSSLIFQSSYAHDNFHYYLYKEWEQDWPNEYDGIYIMDAIMSDLVYFIKNTPEEEFFDVENGIYSKFDKQNLIDFYIYNFFILHDDFWDHNYFIVRNTNPSKFFLVPWDFDRCFGQWLRRNSAPDRNDEEFLRQHNLLFDRLLTNAEFKNDCKTRWFSLRDTIWVEEAIIDMLMEYYEEIKEVLDIDTNLWYHNLWAENWEEEIDKSIDHVFEWIPNRLVFCDSYFVQF
ncbi:MAG: CotH kinase family protein [Candidatus Hodarchaeota archaeon]